MDSANNNKQAVMAFIEKLKHRNVIKVAIAYAVGAWAIAQVPDFVLDNVGAPIRAIHEKGLNSDFPRKIGLLPARLESVRAISRRRCWQICQRLCCSVT